MGASVADDMIRSYFDRWQRLEEEKSSISDDLKELFAEARGNGLDTKALRAVFREQVGDKAAIEEFDAICDLYRASLNAPRAGRARESQSYAEAKGAEPATGRRFKATVYPDGSSETTVTEYDLETGEILAITDTQEQPETASQSPSDAATVANMEPDDVDRSAERASSAVEVGATNSPERATRRLDDLGSVQDGLKMSTDGQPKTGLSTDCIERPIEARVTAGETAPLSPSAAPPADTVAEPQAPRPDATVPHSPDPLPPVVDDGQPYQSANVPPAQKTAVAPAAGQDGYRAEHSSGEFAQQSAGDPQGGNEAVSGEPASVTNSKPDCLKLRNGHCKISFETSALCSECNRAKAENARAA